MIAALLIALMAQPAEPVPGPCPTVKVTGSAVGGAKFVAQLTGADPKLAIYSWTVSAGAITSGQYTRAIVVEASKGAQVTAFVDVSGYGPECRASGYATVGVE